MNEYLTQMPVASIIFALTLIASFVAFSNPNMHRDFMLHPYSINRGYKVWSIITSGFIHADLGHLFMNMFTFYFFAFPLERIIGHWQFGVLYLASMALADISTILKYKDVYGYYSLGASGAIAAVLFSFILFFPDLPIQIFLIPIGIPAALFAVLYLLYSFFASRQSSQINHEAHFYGALSGAALTILFYPSVFGHFVQQVRLMLPGAH